MVSINQKSIIKNQKSKIKYLSPLTIMRVLLLLLALTLPFTGHSQNAIEEVVSILNAVRTDPQNFIVGYLNPYIEKNNLSENKYATSLIAELKSGKKMEALQLLPKISKISKAHAIDLGSKGKVGHNSSDGTTLTNAFDKKQKRVALLAKIAITEMKSLSTL
jgi:uncharacterized protein YkwD